MCCCYDNITGLTFGSNKETIETEQCIFITLHEQPIVSCYSKTVDKIPEWGPHVMVWALGHKKPYDPTSCKVKVERKIKEKKCSKHNMLIDWVRSGLTGKYLAFGNDAHETLHTYVINLSAMQCWTFKSCTTPSFYKFSCNSLKEKNNRCNCPLYYF